MIGNLDYYKVFYFAAKSGSITEAANTLSVSQPAVSQAIRQLEKQLGITLFHRVYKGIRLSQEGRVLFSYVENGYEQIEQGIRRVRQMQNLEFGEIRIGASDMTLEFYLLPHLELFHERYPDIKVIVTNAPTPETLCFLEEGKIDFGIVSSPFAEPAGIRQIAVKEIEDVFVAGRKFISYKNKMLDLQELERLPLIFLEKSTSTRSYMDNYLHQNNVAPRPEFELATSDMIVQFALRNLGVGCVVRDFAEEAIESGLLFELRFNKMIPKRQFCVVNSTKTPLSPAAFRLFGIMGLERTD